MSDGIVSAPTSVLFGVIAAGALVVAARRARTELDERAVPLAGLVAAFIFAMQMVNFPILPGVSGHLLGGALAAILVGPYTGALCIAIVLVVQSLLFADGGVSALGTNITNMAVISVVAGYATALAVAGLLRRGGALSVRQLGAVSFVAALVGTVCAAMGFVLEYAIGGAARGSLGSVAAYVLGTHVLIGIGEGVITALTVMAVGRARPDLVYLLRTQRAPAQVAA
ncbi:MAG TPA: energy-coupling factor ABC transporter permease [Mycobacterium sp.]|uniref:energy-coupling factor ABC transporter permease n=1 Tax=Mycolicibacterium sp. TaxID=2320850 RepID=UPI0025EC6DC4|nr:energy-coupling factor ABC transporter permease [Mycolicibacterium sp.]HPX36291.1 energy-coupling factor ABC transporter permease [Mycobacterium sp.]HQC75144.1 energy-coupling factor ABC transporter permease [Mycobacterium sp.]